MVEQDFAALVTKLCAYFERKQPGPETLGGWFDELKHIPKEALNWIKKQFCEQARFPTNFPAAVNGLWNDWLIAFPERRAKEKKPGCPNCHNGWISVSYETEVGYWGETDLKCAHCNRHGDPKIAPAWTLEQVIMSGKYYQSQSLCGDHAYSKRLPPVPNDKPNGEYVHEADPWAAEKKHSDLDNMVGQVAGGMSL